MKRIVVDVYPHIVGPDIVRYPRAPLCGKPSVRAPQRRASLERSIGEMDWVFHRTAQLLYPALRDEYERKELA